MPKYIDFFYNNNASHSNMHPCTIKLSTHVHTHMHTPNICTRYIVNLQAKPGLINDELIIVLYVTNYITKTRDTFFHWYLCAL